MTMTFGAQALRNRARFAESAAKRARARESAVYDMLMREMSYEDIADELSRREGKEVTRNAVAGLAYRAIKKPNKRRRAA